MVHLGVFLLHVFCWCVCITDPVGIMVPASFYWPRMPNPGIPDPLSGSPLQMHANAMIPSEQQQRHSGSTSASAWQASQPVSQFASQHATAWSAESQPHVSTSNFGYYTPPMLGPSPHVLSPPLQTHTPMSATHMHNGSGESGGHVIMTPRHAEKKKKNYINIICSSSSLV